MGVQGKLAIAALFAVVLFDVFICWTYLPSLLPPARLPAPTPVLQEHAKLRRGAGELGSGNSHVISYVAKLFGHEKVSMALAARKIWFDNISSLLVSHRDADIYDDYDNAKLSEHQRWTRYDLFGPVFKLCPSEKLMQFGTLEDAKFICDLDGLASLTGGPCTIISLGSNNRWDFEEDVFDKTSCTVHTFDCTGNFSVPSRLVRRVYFYPFCVGDARGSSSYISYKQLMETANLKKAPTYLKMDIEAFEWNVFPEMLVHAKDLLPDQIGFELHKSPVAGADALGWKQRKTIWDIALFGELLHLAGYLPIHRRDNVFGHSFGEATEYLIAKVGAPPRIQANTPLKDFATQPPTLPTYIPLYWASTLPTSVSCGRTNISKYGNLDARPWNKGSWSLEDTVMIFVLSWECEEKRMAAIDARMTQLDLNFMFIEAVDGSRITKSMVPAWPCPPRMAAHAFQSWYLSNIKAFEAFLTLKPGHLPLFEDLVSPTEYLLVVEDNVLLPSNFTQELKVVEHVLVEADAVFMGRKAEGSKWSFGPVTCCHSLALYHESVVKRLWREMDYHIPTSYVNKAKIMNSECTPSGFLHDLLVYLNLSVAFHHIDSVETGTSEDGYYYEYDEHS